MKTFKLCMAALAVVLFNSCQNEETVATETVPTSNQNQQFVNVIDVSNTPEVQQLAKELKEGKKIQANAISQRIVNCTLDSDIGCGSDTALEIEEYVNTSNCINFSQGTLIFPPQAQQFTFDYSYYIDGDSDINLDRYQFQFDAHIAEIERQVEPLKIAFIQADAQNGCFNERGWNVDQVVYTVILGN
ncbi:hypothetical protein [Tenacibaculum jejuense]|uniref:Probable lipoprotein n=1 Tax=Tenacibaculum jejuense TaxID=584609 RepID=A0A238U467_9FLAO|nr:hypothetical protein [Tenacibaculum jejuense]SNR13835.1 Probable lipoprotein precursor [Tenacibaculum jejuense]